MTKGTKKIVLEVLCVVCVRLSFSGLFGQIIFPNIVSYDTMETRHTD